MEKIKKIIKNIVAVIVMISLIVIVFYQNRDRDFLKFGKSASEQTDKKFQKADTDSTGNRNTDICKVGDNIVHISPTALTTVNKNGNKEIIELLLKHGADINITDAYNWTALMFAARNGHSETVKLLIDNKADIKAINHNSDTAKTLAEKNNHYDIVNMISE